MSWFPNNVARNSHVNLSNVEIGSLELQRLWVLLKVQAIELRATFAGVKPVAPLCPCVRASLPVCADRLLLHG